ncbi:MAG: hypothetical protein QM621_03840 [Aeromicrobium sp.]|uniref:hypothetical protein n=1 Tax=Aeromicrobium sp. TaxID=1871063 RepID=UPI0039E2906A
MSRRDLLDLSVEALTALANPGFVRRARKDLDAGRVPEVEVADDDTVTARFADGVVATLPPGVPVKDAACTCVASGWCRHRVTLVLAYQAQEQAESETTSWTPGDFDDDALAAAVPARSLDRARRGGAMTVRLSVPEGVPTARLPMNTVQFFSSASLAHARCDCRETTGCEHVALAVWAFRAAGGLVTEPVSVQIGQAATVAVDDAEVVAACREVVLAGVDQVDAGVRTLLGRAAEQARRRGWSWVVGDLAEITRQVDARQARSTAADPQRLATALGEAVARLDAAAAEGASSAEILGVGVPGEAELAQLRLISLGARCWSTREGGAGVHIFFLDPDTGQVSVVERSWEGGTPVRERRLWGSSVARIAASQVVTAAARRRAWGLLEVAADRRRTAAHPLGPRSWTPAPSLEDARPPAFVRSRHLGDGLVVVGVEAVEAWGWDAAAQRLDAVLRTPQGQVVLEWTHTTAEPGGVDAIAAVLADEAVRLVSGELRTRGGVPVLTPLAVATDERAVVPAVEAESDRSRVLPPALPRERSAHGQLIVELRRELSGWLHRGVRHRSHAALGRLTDLSARLADAGLTETSALTTAVASTAPDSAAVSLLRLFLLADALDARL